MATIDLEKITFRPEVEQDKDLLVRLYTSTREAELLQTGWSQAEIDSFLRQQFEAQYISYRQAFPDAEYKLIEYQGMTIGRLYLQRNEDEYRLIDIALFPDYRGHKLGTFLIQAILDSAAETVTPVSLHVEHLNPAIKLYRRLGFAAIEDRGLFLFMRWQPGN